MTVPVRLTTAALTVTAGLVVTWMASGCGGPGRPADPATIRAGAQVFQQAGCGTCHTLAAAGARGQIGPNLDQLEPDADTVVRQVRRGGGGMPAYADRLSEDDIEAVAAHVAQVAGRRR
jgi:sulfite dehydrogenase